MKQMEVSHLKMSKVKRWEEVVVQDTLALNHLKNLITALDIKYNVSQVMN